MKTFFRLWLLNGISIVVISYFLPGVEYGSNFGVLTTASLILALINIFIKPLIKVLLLPINLITLGFFGWVVNAITLYLTTLLVMDFNITSYSVGPVNILGIKFPIVILSAFWGIILASMVLNFVLRIISWIIKP